MIGRMLMPLGLGLSAGLAGSLALTRLVRSLLYGVEPSDPLTLLGGAAVLTGTVLLAAYLPARRAARVEPMRALRQE